MFRTFDDENARDVSQHFSIKSDKAIISLVNPGGDQGMIDMSYKCL